MAEDVVAESRLIGQALVDQGLLNQEQLKQLLESQRERKQRLGEAAVRNSFLSEDVFAKFLADFFKLPYSDLKDEDSVDLLAVELLPESIALRYSVIIIKKDEHSVTVAMADPLDVRAVDAVRLETGCRIKKVVASPSSISRAIERCYHAASKIAKSMDHLVSEEKPLEPQLDFSVSENRAQLERLKLEASDAPVVQFVNLLLMRAVQERASDIHIEPEENSMNVRLRIDGQLREVNAPSRNMLQGLTTRIKLLGNLDIAERRLPQDGRFKFKVFDRTIDVRLSCLPTIYGEKLVMRILDRSNLILDMPSLGFDPAMVEKLNRVLKLPHGLIILTGPTGSGKTTTLYAALNSIKSPTKNIITVEDPVEYQLTKINQVQIRPEIGLTFASGLRSILRQDPDIIMVGEIRDRETADICIRSSLTGHLVLSTLHTNDTVSTISRLMDMEIEPFLLAATLSQVIAQRLVRRICMECSVEWKPGPDVLERLRARKNSSGAWKLRRGTGCKKCGQSGYYGRVAVYEQFVISENIKSLIAQKADLLEIKKVARQEGLQTLLESALQKAAEGVTTLDEAFSVCATEAEILE